MSKAWEWPRSWQIPGPRPVQNLQIPTTRTNTGGQMPCSSPRGGGGAGRRWNWLMHKVPLKNSKKEQHVGKETLHFDWFASHFRHCFVTNFHYDGTIQRHLRARTNQSAIRNHPRDISFLSSLPIIHTNNYRLDSRLQRNVHILNGSIPVSVQLLTIST